MKRAVSAVLFVILFAAVGYLFWVTRPVTCLAKSASDTAAAVTGDSVRIIERTVVPASPRIPEVPAFMVFAGDTIRFDRFDLRERMDRELIAFTYGHTNSLLMLKRSARIFPQIEPLLAQNGVPDDLKYLMAIESNLSETAVSVAGAAGLWQFMREVGKEYGLEVAPTVDERYHIQKETVAACSYLKKAHARFGNWMTVAASFNGGINGITRRRETQRQSNAMDLYLVEETSRYMFRILVAKMMFENPELFGFEMEERDLYPYILPKQKVKVSESIEDLAEFAGRYGISYAQLRRANPWLRDTKLVAAKGKTYEILIPDIEAERQYLLHL
ncbi:MAG: lytic transglycosylase domain-containing protein [Bacteroidales bacterium]|nr:lytic transglycosylase domain-containing protein [Bacteroidales bacterium]MBQ6958353.1 lytic transglycosylase domain-containing protein [Bacteroidales bacterium]